MVYNGGISNGHILVVSLSEGVSEKPWVRSEDVGDVGEQAVDSTERRHLPPEDIGKTPAGLRHSTRMSSALARDEEALGSPAGCGGMATLRRSDLIFSPACL